MIVKFGAKRKIYFHDFIIIFLNFLRTTRCRTLYYRIMANPSFQVMMPKNFSEIISISIVSRPGLVKVIKIRIRTWNHFVNWIVGSFCPFNQNKIVSKFFNEEPKIGHIFKISLIGSKQFFLSVYRLKKKSY